MVAESVRVLFSNSSRESLEAAVQIPLGDIYMVKIQTKKELWTRYRHPWTVI